MSDTKRTGYMATYTVRYAQAEDTPEGHDETYDGPVGMSVLCRNDETALTLLHVPTEQADRAVAAGQAVLTICDPVVQAITGLSAARSCGHILMCTMTPEVDTVPGCDPYGAPRYRVTYTDTWTGPRRAGITVVLSGLTATQAAALGLRSQTPPVPVCVGVVVTR